MRVFDQLYAEAAHGHAWHTLPRCMHRPRCCTRYETLTRDTLASCTDRIAVPLMCVQLIGVVVADTEAHARAGARLVRVEYEDLPAVLSTLEYVNLAEEERKDYVVRIRALRQTLSMEIDG